MTEEQDRGTYILLIGLSKTRRIKPGKLPETDYQRGIYLYVGRARKGLRARIGRHLRSQKKIFWHVDYLLQNAKVEDIWVREDYFGECLTASRIKEFLTDKATPIKGFGSSDCSCPGHLFYSSFSAQELTALRKKLGFEKVKIHEIRV